ncbi:MAG: SpaH/EbpB family LPXTG-anchored major pilin [Clostridia bacterium]|nr:SpaH/EbpB family LPXTG-anchored major pilin [Clostridia bacterium]
MKLQKIASFVLALIMILSLGITAFAADELGSITINGVSENNTYEIYKLLDLESYNAETGVYSYKVNADWTGFFATDSAKAYFTVDAQNYATWVAGEDDDTVAAFAKIALDYAVANGISPVKSSKNDEMTFTAATETEKSKGVFSGLELGYYLVDSTVGALCGLTTTNPDASINAKNGIPTIDKQVQEDSTSQWGGENTADIGQTVYFRVTINVHAGAENYVLHDVMPEGITYNQVSKVEKVVPALEGSTTTVADPDVDYTVVTENLEDDCTFEVEFSKEFCDALETNDKIIVYYEGMLNKKAVIAGDGNVNTAWLSFGEGNESNKDTTVTKTFAIDVVKTDSQNKLIDGAQFRIYDAATGGNEVGVVLMDDGVTYRRARADEAGVPIIVKDGQVRVVGFDNGTYYLEETVSPEGYNKLAARQRFIISDANLDAVYNDGIFSTGSGVHVVNKSGSMLPETGGIGTTIFYVAGGLLVGGAVVALVSKKRMSSK